MFCCHCGAQLEQKFKFCPSCGSKRQSINGGASEEGSSQGTSSTTTSVSVRKNPSNSSAVTSAPIPSFSSFRKVKEAERRSHFEPKTKKKKIEKKEEVLINVGLMEVDFTGSLKRVFGKTLPVQLSTDMNYDEVLERSLKKWKDYDRTFSQERDYVLAYPDTNLARTIPGTDEDFTLKKYKEGLGKSYSRITLFLAPVPETGDIEDTNLPDPCPIDREFEIPENINMDEVLNDDLDFLCDNGYIASAPAESTSNRDTDKMQFLLMKLQILCKFIL